MLKTFPLREFTNEDGSASPLNARKMFEVVLSESPGKGLSLKDIRKRLGVLDKIEATKAPELCVLEDAEFELLRWLFNEFPWGRADRALLAVGDDLEKAEKL